MPKIDIATTPIRSGSSYPEPYASQMSGRSFQSLGDIVGLTQFGVNLYTMQPGATSSLRHWHTGEDEFLWVIAGELVLVEDGGETVLHAGDAAGFRAGDPNGHHLRNRTAETARFLTVGTRATHDICRYSDVDLVNHTEGERCWFTRRDGTFVKDA